MKAQHSFRCDAEEFLNFLHRVRRTVDKSWPGDKKYIKVAQKKGKRNAQARQRRHTYIEFLVERLRHRYQEQIA